MWEKVFWGCVFLNLLLTPIGMMLAIMTPTPWTPKFRRGIFTLCFAALGVFVVMTIALFLP